MQAPVGHNVSTEVAGPAEDGGAGFPIRGYCDQRFAAVQEAFAENFARKGEDYREVGASACVTVDGEIVADLWGGWRDADLSQPWTEDTIVALRSTSKGIVGIVANMLADRGLIDLDRPVADYWPAFAAGAKDRLPVRYVLDHRAGLPVLTEPLWPGAIFDWDAMAGALARQEPMWPPGEQAGYHTFTQGFIIGEIVRHVAGIGISDFVRQEISGPLGADVQVGLNAEEAARCADFLDVVEGTVYDTKSSPSPFAAALRAQFPPGLQANTPEWRRAVIPSSSGHGNARGLARIFAALIGCGPHPLVAEATWRRMARVQHEMFEIVGRREIRQGLGVIVNSPPWAYFGPNAAAFGAHGFGGSLVMADPDRRMTIAYTMNSPHRTITTGVRSRRIVDAAYAALGGGGRG